MNHFVKKIKVLQDSQFIFHDIRKLRVNTVTGQYGLE
jgi:hypothetical protein